MEIARSGDRSETKTSFELIGGHPALDLVNTLDWRFRDTGSEELISNYADVVRFIEQSGMIGAGDARRLLRSAPENRAERIVTATRELREALAEILYAGVSGTSPRVSSVRKLEACFNDARAQQQLHWRGDRLMWELPQPVSLAVAVLGTKLERWTVRDIRPDAVAAGVRERRVPLAFSRYQQESHAALVRYEDLRKSHEGAAIQGSAPGVSDCALVNPVESPGLEKMRLSDVRC